MFAERINRIQPSATLAMTSKAAELRAKLKDTIAKTNEDRAQLLIDRWIGSKFDYSDS